MSFGLSRQEKRAMAAAWKIVREFLKEDEEKGQIVRTAACLAVLDALKHGYPPPRSRIVTERNQLRKKKDLLFALLKRRLMRRGMDERRAEDAIRSLNLPSELGRTTRAGPEYAERLKRRIEEEAGGLWRAMSPDERKRAADLLLDMVAALVYRRYSAPGRVEPIRGAPNPLPVAIRDLLERTRRDGSWGMIAHYLVGAKLRLRYKGAGVEVHSQPFTGADKQRDAPGDHWVGDAAFHVTVSPGVDLMSKCMRNLERGYRPWILTESGKVEDARRMLREHGLGDKAWAESIEDFVGQNLEEIAEFKIGGLKKVVESLIEEYNEMVKREGVLAVRLRLEWLEEGLPAIFPEGEGGGRPLDAGHVLP